MFALGAELTPYNPSVYPAKAVIPMADFPQDYESPDLGVSDQKWVGRCVSESVCACVEEFLYEETGEIIRVSRDMFYQNREPHQYQYSGMIPGEACDNIRHFGVARENACPDQYREYNAKNKADFTPNILDNAYLQRSITTCRISNITELKNALSKPKTACFIVIPVYDSFMFYQRGVLKQPDKSSEKLWGHHAVKVADYHSREKLIVPKNSWGSSWGEKGKVLMPEDYCISEMWAITDYTPQYDVLEIFINKNIRIFNGEITKIDVAPFIKEGRTMSPPRHTHEPFGDIVKWDAAHGKVTIMRPKIPKV